MSELDRYRLDPEEKAHIRDQNLPAPVALGWLTAKRRAEGRSLVPNVPDYSGLLDNLGLRGDLFPDPRTKK